MKQRVIKHYFILAVILGLASSAFAKTCYECHKDEKKSFKKKFVHSPV